MIICSNYLLFLEGAVYHFLTQVFVTYAIANKPLNNCLVANIYESLFVFQLNILIFHNNMMQSSLTSTFHPVENIKKRYFFKMFLNVTHFGSYVTLSYLCFFLNSLSVLYPLLTHYKIFNEDLSLSKNFKQNLFGK